MGAAEPPSDAELLRRHVAGDADAFPELVRRHQDRLWSVAVRTLADAAEAEDALQDALLSALRAAAGFRGDAQVSTWLHRIVVNASLDRMRRRQARPTVPLADDAHAPAPRDAIAERELRLDVHAALRRIPDEQRAAVVLVDMEGWPVAAVADTLGVPVGTVKSRCARGRARLAELLGYVRAPETTELSGSRLAWNPAAGPLVQAGGEGGEVTGDAH